MKFAIKRTMKRTLSVACALLKSTCQAVYLLFSDQLRRLTTLRIGSHRAALAALLLAPLAVQAAETPIDWNKAQTAAFGAHDIKIGGVLGERIGLTIDGNIRQLEIDRDFIKPFREKTLPQGRLNGARCVETGNLIEAIALLAALKKDPALHQLGAKMVADLIACQEPDGYLGTFPQEGRGRPAFWDTEDVSLIILGLLTWHELFGDSKALLAAQKSMDYTIATWTFKGMAFIGT